MPPLFKVTKNTTIVREQPLFEIEVVWVGRTGRRSVRRSVRRSIRRSIRKSIRRSIRRSISIEVEL